jgi:hypothetical protein
MMLPEIKTRVFNVFFSSLSLPSNSTQPPAHTSLFALYLQATRRTHEKEKGSGRRKGLREEFVII